MLLSANSTCMYVLTDITYSFLDTCLLTVVPKVATEQEVTLLRKIPATIQRWNNNNVFNIYLYLLNNVTLVYNSYTCKTIFLQYNNNNYRFLKYMKSFLLHEIQKLN